MEPAGKYTKNKGFCVYAPKIHHENTNSLNFYSYEQVDS